MPCPHGQNSTPASCSQCIGAEARRVRSDEVGVTIDGVKVRAGILETGIVSAPRPDRTRIPPVRVAEPTPEPVAEPRLLTAAAHRPDADPMPMTPEQVADLIHHPRRLDKGRT